MSRQKQRKGRQARAGRVFVQVQGGRGDGLKVELPGVTVEDWQKMQQLNGPAAGKVAAALVEMMGGAPNVDFTQWGMADTIGLLRWLGCIPEGKWTVLDDIELVMAQGGGDGR